MISLLNDNYNILNFLLVIIEIFLPLLLYIISFCCITTEKFDELNDGVFNIPNYILNENYNFLISSFVFIFSGLSVEILSDYYYRKKKGKDVEFLSKYKFNIIKQDQGSIPLYIFPLMLIISNITYTFYYFFKNTFITGILFYISAILNSYLIFYYSNIITSYIGLSLLPLLIWQIYNGYYFINGFLN